VNRQFGVPACDLPRPRKVRDIAHSDREASVFCSADHGDGLPRCRVAVLTRNPRKLVTDVEEVNWPAVPSRSVLAFCKQCWKVPCKQCSLMESEYCPHVERGEKELSVAKIKDALGHSKHDLDVAELAWVRALATGGSTL